MKTKQKHEPSQLKHTRTQVSNRVSLGSRLRRHQVLGCAAESSGSIRSKRSPSSSWRSAVCFSRFPSSALHLFLGEGSPTKIDDGKKGTLSLTSLLEDHLGWSVSCFSFGSSVVLSFLGETRRNKNQIEEPMCWYETISCLFFVLGEQHGKLDTACCR